MNTDYLHYFELAYREGNFSAAARKVPVSPQGLTKAIHTLEKDLGVILFTIDEGTGAPVPTEYAHELLQFAQVFESNVRLLEGSFQAIRGCERHLVTLGCSLGVLGTFGPMFLERFHETHPNVTIDSWEASDALVAQSLSNADCDLALLVGACPPTFASTELYRCRQYFWVNASDPLASKDELALDDLEGYDIAIPGSGFDCYRRLCNDTRAAGVGLGHIYQMSEIFQLYEFAASGKGLGFSVEHLVNLPVFVRDDQVVAIPLRNTEWHFSLCSLNTHALDDAEQAFWSYCRRCAKELKGRGAS